jgi:hypothetical protein
LQAVEAGPVMLAKDIFDDRAGFGDDMTIVFDHR